MNTIIHANTYLELGGTTCNAFSNNIRCYLCSLDIHLAIPGIIHLHACMDKGLVETQ